jgi:hypothetical protein
MSASPGSRLASCFARLGRDEELRHSLLMGEDDPVMKANRFVKKGFTGYDACYAAPALDVTGCWFTSDEQAHKRIEAERVSFLLSEGLPRNWWPG